jgi:glycosyltransferase involved in cell wall biosynthesis
MKRLRILAIAYACNPTKGSDEAVGWGWARAIAERHDVTVITADFHANDISRHSHVGESANGNNPRFIYVKNRTWHYRPQGIWKKIECSIAKPLMNLAYQNWLSHAFAQAKREVALTPFDVVHLITYVGWRFPGAFYRLGLPFVWGPIGGLQNTKWRLLPSLGPRGAFYHAARNSVNSLQIKLLPGPRRALQAACGSVIAATSEIQEKLWEHFGTKSQVISEVGPPDLPPPAEPRKRAQEEPFKICWSGLHLPRKALHLLLRAAARLPRDLDYCIEILGDGPCGQPWRALASRLGVQSRCRWHGQVSREQSLTIMKTCHLFSITSLSDLTSNVAVEAISLGLPIVCLDHCGFADLVTPECGIKVRVGSIGQIVSDLAAAIGALCRDEDYRRQLAQGALRRTADYSWQKKMDTLDEIYAQIPKLNSTKLPARQSAADHAESEITSGVSE